MTTETYIPGEVSCAGRPLGEVLALTLYDVDSDDPHGALTTHQPLPVGTRTGPLVAVAARGGAHWRVVLPEIEVCRSTAVGFEFLILGRAERVRVGDLRGGV